ncbi:LUD domain-containing protein [Chitinophaga sp.]|uniref:LutC/YkgG family protein n=1 Tax=Chitinophaga sp. TaxID=1869181 RepID=UPI0031D1864F
MSRASILSAVKQNQPEQQALPELELFHHNEAGDPAAFAKVVTFLGGQVIAIKSYTDMLPLIKEHPLVVTTHPEFYPDGMQNWQEGDGRQLEKVDLAIIQGRLGVAENGAIWVTDDELQVRALPFIAQHLAIVLKRTEILPTMHDAYRKIGGPDAGFGVFIAGPSKTADIEQSLVLGAHGAKSLTVFLID